MRQGLKPAFLQFFGDEEAKALYAKAVGRIEEIGGDKQIIGVYATTSRRRVRILGADQDFGLGDFVQVARQGNPLFNEGLVAIKDKDLYSRTTPDADALLFRKYAVTPELAALINVNVTVVA